MCHFQIGRLIGDDRNSLKLDVEAPNLDVIVMTPRILENHLIRNGQEQLDMFSMLVFDECHHTRKDEPYNMLMRYYLKRKNIRNARNIGEQSNVKLPQVHIIFLLFIHSFSFSIALLRDIS